LLTIVDALGPNRISALPTFHALSGAGNNGSFAGKGKLDCWKVFHYESDEIITAMSNTGTTAKPTEETLCDREVCAAALFAEDADFLSQIPKMAPVQKEACTV
jgi:hypothetical protein